MHPYRTPPPDPPRPREPAAREDWALALGMFVIGSVRVIAAIAQDEAFATESTIALIMAVIGAAYAIRLATSASASS